MAAWMCVLIAFLNATAWSVITPPFQGKDEVDHFAYVEHLAETGALPKGGSVDVKYSPEQSVVMEGLHYFQVRFTPFIPAISSRAEQQTLMEDVHAGASLQESEGAGVATPEPPLYYALQTIPYALGGGNVLAKIQLMRLFGALLGAVTVLLTFLFLRETLPAIPWAASIGALCIALQPLFGSMSGSINPDTMLYTVAAAIFLCLARAFRRGFTPRLAVVLGLLIAAGFLTKLNFIGLAFGVFVGLVVLAVHESKSRGRVGLQAPLIAAGIGLAPVMLYALLNAIANKPTFGIASGVAGTIGAKSLFHECSYIWQMYLPRLPGMTHYFKGMATYKDVWFDRSVGLYGWMDTTFPGWVDNVALVPAVAIALLCGRELVAHRHTLSARLPEISIYAAITIGVLVMLGVSSYGSDVIHKELAYGEPRYLLPMLPLLGAVIVLAVRGAGRKWAPVIGAAIVLLFLGHDIFSQLQVIARYYG
jgi:4-amino-4-deoxy-L-arabinose transferase-like glycosyltransferase